jgi:hypothetical protein
MGRGLEGRIRRVRASLALCARAPLQRRHPPLCTHENMKPPVERRVTLHVPACAKTRCGSRGGSVQFDAAAPARSFNTGWKAGESSGAARRRRHRDRAVAQIRTARHAHDRRAVGQSPRVRDLFRSRRERCTPANMFSRNFTQVMGHVPWHVFRRCVARYDGDRKIKHFSCHDQFHCFAFVQLTWRESLRDIEACLKAQSSKLYHLGFRRPRIARNTMSNANSVRDWRLCWTLNR